MESEEVIPQDTTPLSVSYEEYLEELCAYYMSIGVPCDEFWHGDYTYLKYYEQAHAKKLEEQNTLAWIQGMYVYNAVGTALANAFGKREAKYIQEPLDFVPKSEYQQKLEVIRTRNRLARQLEVWKAKFNGRNRQPGN